MWRMTEMGMCSRAIDNRDVAMLAEPGDVAVIQQIAVDDQGVPQPGERGEIVK